MFTMKEVFDKFQQIGCCSFATLDGHGGIDTRIAHFVAYDDDGLYLTTMDTKPFYREMNEGGKLAVSGEFTEKRCWQDEDHLPKFAPGFTMRVRGDVRQLTPEEIQAHAAIDPNFNVVIHDIKKYPRTVCFVLYRAWGEYYDYDFNMVNRNHKLYRERFAWGGATFIEPGFTITDTCIECGTCAPVCSFKAIEPGNPYRIKGSWCDECGNCAEACPVNAILTKGE